MHRLFVAVRPPFEVRAMLLSIMGGVQGARWQTDDQLHLTLRFIGEVDRRQAEDVHAALLALRHPAFEIAARGLGTFDRRGTPAALWAGVTPQEDLRILHKKVDQACQRAGLPPERRAYAPHITLARLGRAPGPLDSVMADAGRATSAPFRVDHFSLYESCLTPEGAVYTAIEHYPLL
jgi:2'-5' RNA ligase